MRQGGGDLNLPGSHWVKAVFRGLPRCCKARKFHWLRGIAVTCVTVVVSCGGDGGGNWGHGDGEYGESAGY